MDQLKSVLEKENSLGNIWNELKKRFKDGGEYTQQEVKNYLLSALKCCSYYEINEKEYEFNELEAKLLECNGTSENEITKLVDKMLEELKVQAL